MTKAPPGLGGEDFGGSLTYGTDGKLYVQAGKTAFWNLEVTGLDSVRALPGGRLLLTAADLPKAQAIREAQLQNVQTRKTALVKQNTPAFSGSLDAAFKGSDIVSYRKGEDAAVLYRRVAAQKKPRTFNSGVFHNYTMDYVRVVPGAKITVTRQANGYTVEAALPMAALGLKPVGGLTVRGDFGVTYGDPAGQRTRLQVYWSNQQTGIVDDTVAELMMQPKNWGQITLGK